MQPVNTYAAATDYESSQLADYALGPVKWGAAVVGDLGTTIYNSIVPETYETSTYDVLSSFNADVADHYLENKDAVELGSFVGGMIIPGLGVARAAKMAANVGGGLFGGIGRISTLGYSAKKIEKYTNQAAQLATKGSAQTAAMKSALWKQRLWTAENAFAENVLFESAFYAVMNDHAYMDDYGLDTFAISTAIGTAFTTPISLAIRSKNVKDASAALQLGLHKKYGTGNLYAVDPSAVAAKYDVGTAQAGIEFTIDDLTNQLNKITDPADAEMRSLVQSNLKEQQDISRESATSMLDTTAQKKSAEYQQPKDVPTQEWHELRTAAPYEVNTPLQMVGHFIKKNPNDLIGAEREGIKLADETLSNIGVKEVAKKREVIAEDGFLPKEIMTYDKAIGTLGVKEVAKKGEVKIAEDGFLTEEIMTYDEAIDTLGGDKFKVNDKIAHMYEWDGEVYLADAVQGRLLRGAADVKATVDLQYDLGAASTYRPMAEALMDTDLEFLSAMKAADTVQSMTGTVDALDLPKLQAAVVRGLGVKVKQGDLSVNDTITALSRSKIYWVSKMNERGFDIRQISKATNTPMETAEAILQAGDSSHARDMLVKGKDVRWMVYNNTSEEAYTKYLTPTTLTVNVTPRASNPWQGAIQQDRDLLANITRSSADAIAVKSKSDLFREVYNSTAGKSTNAALEQNLWQLYATGAAGSKWTSTDMYFRAWENLNDTLVTMGQDFQQLINERGIAPMRKIMQPLAEAVATDGKAAIVNVEHLRNALDEIPSGAVASKMRYESSTRKVILTENAKGEKTYLPIPGTKQDWRAEFDSVNSFVEDGVIGIGKSLWEMRKTNGELTNTVLSSARGLHIPYDNISDDFVSYLIDPSNPKNIKRISGNNLADMQDKVARIKEQVAGTGMEIVPRAELDRTWNKINDYSSLEYLQEANPDLLKSGIAAHEVTGSVDVLDRILKSYESDITKQARIFQRTSNSTVFDTLAQLSRHHDDLADSARGTDAQKMQKTLNPARLASKTLLNISKSGDNPLMDGANNATDIAIDWTRDTLSRAWNGVRNKLSDGHKLAADDFNKVGDELKAHNIPNPWKDIQDYIQASTPRNKQQSKETVAAGSQIMTLFNLRLADIAHGVVTTLSAPALIMGESALKGGSPMKSMMQVSRYFWNDSKRPDIQQIRKVMKEKGYGARKTSEATTLLNKAVGSRGFLQHLSDTDAKTLGELVGKVKEKPSAAAIGDAAYKGLTRVSDASEEVTREFAYLTGYEISKTKSPLAVAEVHEEFANLFTNRAMGNYAARQRPAMFQGSFGQAMGLYQTFMLTVGQNLTRMIEAKNVKALGAFGGSYTGMFGLESLPFYSDVNTMVGNWLQEPDHQDITQTVYKAFGNKYAGHERSVGEFLLYGAPSALFQSAWYTRGDLDPRVPIDSGRIAPPIITAMADLFVNTLPSTVSNVAKLSSVGAPITDIGAALAEGVMMQSMWRPAARLSELGMGYSIDRKGEILSQQEDVRNKWHPIFARVSGARPLKEAVLRQTRYANRLYDTTDTQRRRKSVRALRTHLRGDKDSGVVGGLMQDYLRNGGSPEGWGSVLSKSYLSSKQPFSEKLLGQIKNQEGIIGIVEGYGF